MYAPFDTDTTSELTELAELLYHQLDPVLAGHEAGQLSPTRATQLLEALRRRCGHPTVEAIVDDALADLARVARRRRHDLDVTAVLLAAVVEIEAFAQGARA